MFEPIKVVVNTNILVSALWSKSGNPADIIRMIADEKIIPCYCEEIILEYRAVLSRPAFKFSQSQVDNLMTNIIKYGKKASAKKSSIPMPDEDDRIFYDVAKKCGAILITGNIKHFPIEDDIMKPADFLKLTIHSP